MPKVVDHEARRRQVAEHAVRLVATQGIDSLTTRTVAGAVGHSTAAISHYFAGKDDLLLATFTFASDRARDRFVMTTSSSPRELRLYRGLESLLAIGEDARQEWAVFMAFWGKAIALPALAKEQAARVRSAAHRVATLLADDAGVDLTPAERIHVARRLLATVQGISTYAIFDAEEWNPARQRRMLQDLLAAALLPRREH